MAERLNAHDSKSCYAGMYTRVQIPFSAPNEKHPFLGVFFLYYLPFSTTFHRGMLAKLVSKFLRASTSKAPALSLFFVSAVLKQRFFLQFR